MSDIFQFLASLDPAWMYAMIFFVAFLENVFPPSPSDAVVVFGGALAAMERGSFLAALIAGSLGSAAGFVLVYFIGRWFGRSILDAGKVKFIQPATLARAESWFARYGYWIIVANRFLAGTRAVVSFVAGISRMDFALTAVLSLVGSILWYSILLYAGYSLGHHWEKVGFYLKTYSEVVTAVVVVVLIVVLARSLRNNSSGKKGA